MEEFGLEAVPTLVGGQGSGLGVTCCSEVTDIPVKGGESLAE